MANLTIDSLRGIVDSGNIERMYGGQGAEFSHGAPAEIGEAGLAPPAPGQAAPVSPDGPVTFSEILRDSVAKVNQYQHQADTAIRETVAGRNKNIHETMLTIERADDSLKLMMNVRNKILDAYREIMRMQV